MRNFERDGGGSIRMYGILNALVDKGHDVIFISNATTFVKFDKRIKHIYINHEISGLQKAFLQGLTSLISHGFIYLFYKKLFYQIKIAIEKVPFKYKCIYFFEYLDNTLGYLLKKKNIISCYVNDLHGIATAEFKYQYATATRLKPKIVATLKYKMANILDRKVFEYGDGFIYASNAMKDYFDNKYKLENKKAFIIPYVLGKEVANARVDLELKTKLQENLGIKKSDFIFFFAGGYKPTAGVQDLINAFATFLMKYENGKLLLIGSGPTQSECLDLIKKEKIEDSVLLIDKIPYQDLITYQSLAHVVVCPDRQNPYSNLIVHLKYFDSLASGAIVINGNFDSVKEINKNNFLSLSFEPSDVGSLLEAMTYCYKNYNRVSDKYKSIKNFTLQNLTYESYIGQLSINEEIT